MQEAIANDPRDLDQRGEEEIQQEARPSPKEEA